MRAPLRTLLCVLLASALATPAPLVAQDAAAPVSPAEAAAAALAGSWSGWARLANDWPALPCGYEGAPDGESVKLELADAGGLLRGSVAIDIPAPEGSGCPALRKRYAISEVATGPGTLAFTDSGGNEWTLAVRRQGRELAGLLAWRAGGSDQPLAEGFSTQGGLRPPARLAGEVQLRKAGAAPEAAAQAASAAAPQAGGAARPAPAPQKTGAGRHLRNLGIVLGANVVGLAGLYGVNKLGKGSSDQGAVTCSPRVCIVGAPNAPCLCYNEIVNGASCGETKTGLVDGEPGCDGVAKPCAANLSCNSGTCQDENGRCPF